MIYTRTGDHGETSLADGSRVSKNDLRVEAYGTVDELNGNIGLLRAMITAMGHSRSAEYETLLLGVQHKLFVIQTLLATADDERRKKLPQITAIDIKSIEHEIDKIEKTLPRLTGFVIAGGSMGAAQCDVARCVCRRAERRIVALADKHETEPLILVYINRLSDLLFVLSRQINHLNGTTENLYTIR